MIRHKFLNQLKPGTKFNISSSIRSFIAKGYPFKIGKDWVIEINEKPIVPNALSIVSVVVDGKIDEGISFL